MLRSGISILCICLAVGLFAQAAPPVDIGAEIGDFQLPDESGNMHTLGSYRGKIVVFVSWSYKCPSCIRYTNRLDILHGKYDENRVVVLGISTGDMGDAAAIRANKANLGIHFPVLLDRDGRLAAMLGATHIPSVFIIDENARLRYRGAIDNDKQIGDRRREAYAEDAIEALLSSRTVAVKEIEAKGCMIRP
jgi:peroxiredoxin